MNSPYEGVLLGFKTNALETGRDEGFGVWVQVGGGCELRGLFIIISSLEAVHANLWQLLLSSTSTAAMDRVSEMLPYGSSVSVAFRKRAVEGGRMIVELDIMIDDCGKLLWPNMSNSICLYLSRRNRGFIVWKERDGDTVKGLPINIYMTTLAKSKFLDT